MSRYLLTQKTNYYDCTPEQQAAYERQTVAFYDIDKKGWRSMRIDTIWSYQRALKLT